MDKIDPGLQLHDHPPRVYIDRPPRKRTCLNGKLVYGGGAFTLDCTIRNISDGGAKVMISSHEVLPPDLYLIVIKYCVAYEAKLAWLRFPARGLKFSNAYHLCEVVPDELEYLRRLWDDLCGRSGVKHAGIDQIDVWQRW